MVEEEAQYDVVLKMVLWDEGREAIFHRLKVNGIEGDRAHAIYQRARAERMHILRGEGLKALFMGLVSFAVAAGVYYYFKLDEFDVGKFGDGVHGLPLLPCLLGFIVVMLAFFGLWKSIQGIFETLFASSKKGSIGDS